MTEDEWLRMVAAQECNIIVVNDPYNNPNNLMIKAFMAGYRRGQADD